MGRGSLLERTIHPEYRTPAVRGDKWLSGGGEPPLPAIDVMLVTGLDLMPCFGAAKGQDLAGKAAADLTWRYQAHGDQTHPAWAQLTVFSVLANPPVLCNSTAPGHGAFRAETDMCGLLAFTEQGTSQFHAPGGGSAALVHAEQTPLPCSTKAGYLRVPTSVLAQDLLKSGEDFPLFPSLGV